MIFQKTKALLRPLKRALSKNPYRFLSNVSGVVHVGANLGQERDLYRALGLSVLWIEPIPDVFSQLQINISGYSNQRAVQALVTDVDDKEYEFHLANNEGQSSSIFQLKQHKDIWPDVYYTSSVSLRGISLATLFKRENIDATKYQALIMDTQGSELLVLQGSLPVLAHFAFVKLEVANFESYEGCCQLSDINGFMIEHAYKEFYRYKFASRVEGGEYFDIVYRRRPI